MPHLHAVPGPSPRRHPSARRLVGALALLTMASPGIVACSDGDSGAGTTSASGSAPTTTEPRSTTTTAPRSTTTTTTAPDPADVPERITEEYVAAVGTAIFRGYREQLEALVAEPTRAAELVPRLLSYYDPAGAAEIMPTIQAYASGERQLQPGEPSYRLVRAEGTSCIVAELRDEQGTPTAVVELLPRQGDPIPHGNPTAWVLGDAAPPGEEASLCAAG